MQAFFMLTLCCRRHLAGLLKEHSLVEGGDLQVATWIKDEGFDTTIPSVMQVLHSSPMQGHDPTPSCVPTACTREATPLPVMTCVPVPVLPGPAWSSLMTSEHRDESPQH